MRTLVMLGPDQPGGMTSVLTTYRESVLAAHYELRFVRTTSQGNLMGRLLVATSALIRVIVLGLSRPRPLFHIHTASGRSFKRKSVLLAAVRILGCRSVLHIHGGAFVDWGISGGPLRRALISRLLALPDSVVVLSSGSKVAIEQAFGKEGAVVIGNPVRVAREAPDVLRRDLVLFAGRLVADKGIFDLLTAARALQTGERRVELVLAGDGEEIASVRSRVAELPMPSLVSVPGWVSWEDLEQHLARSTLFCLPSYCEALPVALLEAMAAGVPCIATNVGGIPSVIADKVNGLLIEPGRPDELVYAIQYLLDHPAECERLGRAGKAYVLSNYEISSIVSKLEDLYAGLGYPPARG